MRSKMGFLSQCWRGVCGKLGISALMKRCNAWDVTFANKTKGDRPVTLVCYILSAAIMQAPAKTQKNASRHITKYTILVNNAFATALNQELVLYALRNAIVRYVMELIASTHCRIFEDGSKIR